MDTWSDNYFHILIMLAADQSGTEPNFLVAKILATNFGIFFVI